MSPAQRLLHRMRTSVPHIGRPYSVPTLTRVVAFEQPEHEPTHLVRPVGVRWWSARREPPDTNTREADMAFDHERARERGAAATRAAGGVARDYAEDIGEGGQRWGRSVKRTATTRGPGRTIMIVAAVCFALAIAYGLWSA